MTSEDHVGFYSDHLLPALFKCIFSVYVCECICVSVYVNYTAGGGVCWQQSYPNYAAHNATSSPLFLSRVKHLECFSSWEKQANFLFII